jgi:hypothetical protein
MVIERFEGNNMLPVYERQPKWPRPSRGLRYVNSWIKASSPGASNS